jgi:phage terminase small subunit
MMSAADALRALSARHRVFVQTYCTNGFNATQAALAAGYAESGAAVRGHELVRNRNIRAAVRAVLDEALMTPAELKARIADDALATMEPFLEVTGNGGLQFNFNTPQAKAALRWVKRVTITPTDNGDKIALEIVDSQKAKDQLTRVFGLNDDKVEVTGDGVVVHAYFPNNGRGRSDDDG